jgi:hypothetical protein
MVKKKLNVMLIRMELFGRLLIEQIGTIIFVQNKQIYLINFMRSEIF